MGTVTQNPSLTLVRSFDAAPAKVWQAWTDPNVIRRWFAPNDTYTVAIAEADVRVGGRYRIKMDTPAGESRDVSGTYREVVPAQKLVFTWAWASTPERESLVTIQIRPVGERTELTLKHEQFFDDSARDRHNTGWTAALANFERLLR
jgi:uncharacterized protein YndB with AHSA1/START domain